MSRTAIVRTAKEVAASLLMSSGLYGRVLGDRAVVVAFHRIDDRYPEDSLTYGVDSFAAFCRYVRDRFQVVSLPSLLDDLEAQRPIAGKLAITFDDGYLDNFTSAAPILADLGLPATFFIATGFIGTQTVPWWDKNAGIEAEWMDWPQVVGLHQAGFDIGAHTVTHADLGEIGGREALAELRGSKEALEDHLSTSVDLFAYPYGRPENMTEANRALVREAGFRCCPSCFGGTVSPGDDPYRLKRLAISAWFSSPRQFAVDLLRE